MLTFLDTITGFIAPHQCIGCGKDGDILCSACSDLLPDTIPTCYRCQRFSPEGATCKSCKNTSPLRSVRTVTYYEGVAETVVGALKFGRTYAAANTIAQTIAHSFVIPENAVIVPVPTAQARVRQRGYDQSVLIARMFAKQSGVPCKKLLSRHGSQRQTGSSRAERLKQLEGAFSAKKCEDLRKTPIILVDDVMTTGATLEAAARVLKTAGAKEIHGLTFARA